MVQYNLLSPEFWNKKKQNGKNFQTSVKHEKGEYSQVKVIENTEIIGWSQHAESRSDIGNTAYCCRKCCFQVNIGRCQDKGAKGNAQNIQRKENKHTSDSSIVKGAAVNFYAFNGSGVT